MNTPTIKRRMVEVTSNGRQLVARLLVEHELNGATSSIVAATAHVPDAASLHRWASEWTLTGRVSLDALAFDANGKVPPPPPRRGSLSMNTRTTRQWKLGRFTVTFFPFWNRPDLLLECRRGPGWVIWYAFQLEWK